MRAEIALERGDTTSALMDYDRLTEVHSDSPLAVDAHSRIGFVYAGRGEHIRAADHFSRAANMAGGARGGESGRRALYSAAVAFMNGGDPDQAAKLFASLTDTDPSGPWGVEAAYHLGEALYESGDYSGSRTAYEKAARYGDSSWAFEAAYAIGWTWFRESDWENAAKAFERAADIAPDKEGRARSLYRIGLSRASESAWNQALDFYGQALDIGRGTWREEALYQKAWAQLNLGLLDDSNVTAGILSREFPDSSLLPTCLFAWARTRWRISGTPTPWNGTIGAFQGIRRVTSRYVPLCEEPLPPVIPVTPPRRRGDTVCG
jgi:tetratricopeptide (TPR) repeat protein